MFIDIIAILVLIGFTIAGLCMHFNKTARRIYSLITAMGISAVLLKILSNYADSWTWYQNLSNYFQGFNTLNIISYWAVMVFGSIIISLIINLLYKLIEVGVANISRGTSRICGASFGLLNAVVLVMVVLQALGICGVETSTNIFSGLNYLISIR